jgi:hypothetical protein
MIPTADFASVERSTIPPTASLLDLKVVEEPSQCLTPGAAT